MKSKSKKTTASSKWEIVWPNSQWESQIRIMGTSKEKSDSDGYWNEPGEIWACSKITEDTCCGFPVLGYFERFDDDSVRENVAEIGKALEDKMLAKKIPYMCTYIPNTKEFETEKMLFHAAGFKPTMSLKSIHGRYTNTRWEWYGPTYKKVEDEKIIPTPRIR